MYKVYLQCYIQVITEVQASGWSGLTPLVQFTYCLLCYLLLLPPLSPLWILGIHQTLFHLKVLIIVRILPIPTFSLDNLYSSLKFEVALPQREWGMQTNTQADKEQMTCFRLWMYCVFEKLKEALHVDKRETENNPQFVNINYYLKKGKISNGQYQK